jgi:hypothetical protein
VSGCRGLPKRSASRRRALPAEIAGQARQLRRFGSPDQVERAAALLEDVKRELYAILANGPTRDEHAEGTGT